MHSENASAFSLRDATDSVPVGLDVPPHPTSRAAASDRAASARAGMACQLYGPARNPGITPDRTPALGQRCRVACGGSMWWSGDLISFIVMWESSLSTP